MKSIAVTFENEVEVSVIENCHKSSLSELLKTDIMSRKERLTIAIDIASALAFLHANKVVHQNISQESIFVEREAKEIDERKTVLLRARLGKFYNARIILEPLTIRFNLNTTAYHCFAEKISENSDFPVSGLSYFDVSTAHFLAEDIAQFG